MIHGIKKLVGILLIASVVSVCFPLHVHAQSEDPAAQDNEVKAKGLGVIGGIMGGAEIVLATESFIRIKPLWPWIVLPTVGAVGGGIGGYYLEKKSKGGAIALLITSMVAIIPTTIAVASRTSFRPEDTGAKEGDGGTVYDSYLLDASDENEMQENSVTEIESRPEGVPSDAVGPPIPNNYEGETVDDEPDYPVAPSPDSVQEPTSSVHFQQRERLAHLSSGSLIHINRRRHWGMGIPAIDVVPISIPHPGTQNPHQGVEVQIPLFLFELP